MASKSLFTSELEVRDRKVFSRESAVHEVYTDGVIVEVLTSYRQLSDIDKKSKDFFTSKLEKDFIINSGVHFIVLVKAEDGDFYALIPSPYNEDSLRQNYGSDGNLRGRRVIIKSIDRSRYAIEAGILSFKSSDESFLEDNDKYIPLSVIGLLGGKQNPTNKLKAFLKNTASKSGERFSI